MSQISLCALFFGDHTNLTHRCLSSIWERLSEGQAHIFDIRLGLNAIARGTRSVVDWFTENVRTHYKIPVIHYDCPRNACKYPLMRRMLLEDPRRPGNRVMWFDDDSYLDGGAGWWSTLADRARKCDMLGKRYYQGLRGRQWEWVINQPWFNPDAGKPPRRKGKHSFIFATGGWWVVRADVFRQWDWPTLELKHCGGDSMLGELMRHQGLRLDDFDEGVRINADDRGRHSKATPRGESVRRVLLGADGYVRDRDLSHHNFEMVRRTYGCD